MAASLPVIATPVGGNPEVVIDQETGMLVPARARAIADAISLLWLDPRRRRLMGDAGRWRVIRHFSIARMVDDYASAYHLGVMKNATQRRADDGADGRGDDVGQRRDAIDRVKLQHLIRGTEENRQPGHAHHAAKARSPKRQHPEQSERDVERDVPRHVGWLNQCGRPDARLIGGPGAGAADHDDERQQRPGDPGPHHPGSRYRFWANSVNAAAAFIP